MAVNIHDPNEDLVHVIVAAWKNERPDLMTDPIGALERQGVYVDRPQVVHEADYKSGDEPGIGAEFFVLPQRPGGLRNNANEEAFLATARRKMTVTPFGI